MSMGTQQSAESRWRRRAEIASYLCVAAGLMVVIGNIYLFGAAHIVARWGVGIYATGLAIHATAPLVPVSINWLRQHKRRVSSMAAQQDAVSDLQESAV